MNVLLITPNLNPGGSQKILISLFNNLNTNTFIFNFKKKENFLFNLLNNKSKVIYAKSRYTIFSFFELNKIIQEKKIDIILSSIRTINILLGLYGFFLSKNVKIIFHEPNVLTEFKDFNFKSRIRKTLMRISYYNANKIIANSHDTKRDLLNYKIVDEQKITVISNPIDFHDDFYTLDDRFNHKLKEKKYIIISCGTLSYQKNFDLLIKAFSDIQIKKNNASLVILGEGILEKKLKKLANDLNSIDEILFLGNVKNPQSYFKKSNLYVCSSIFEGFGNTIVEAMLTGLPIVSTNCPGGPKEILDGGKKGYLVLNNNINELKRGILRSIENPIKYSIKEIKDKYLSKNIAKKYEKVFYEKTN